MLLRLLKFIIHIAVPVMIMYVLVYAPGVFAYEISGYIEAEGAVFINDPLYEGQRRHSVSLAVQPEFYTKTGDTSRLVFTPFMRIDSADPERSHGDIRELTYLWYSESLELRAGIGKVFWGATEFLHLVDIINQTDLIEDIDMEEKLGQPMVHLSLPRQWGVVDVFLLPYFRERTFPGRKGRLRTQLEVSTDRAVYESPAEQYHVDTAVRYSRTAGDWDFGIYYFRGTGREPTLILNTEDPLDPVLVPYYEQISQTGLDVQSVKGSWLFKLESIYRAGQGEPFIAAVGGVEYSFVNIAMSGIDFGLIGEWAYDERGENATTSFDNDMMIGARLALNDIAGTEALFGMVHDMDSEGSVLTLESGRRLDNHWKINVNALFVLDSSDEDAVHALRDDDHVRMELVYYF